MRLYILFLAMLFVCLSFNLNAQHQDSLKTTEGLNGNLEMQFDYVFKRSATYEKNKVISKYHFDYLKKSSTDSLKKYNKEVLELKATREILLTEVDSLKSDVKVLEEELLSSKKDKDSFSVLGMSIKKGLYNIIMIGILVFLVLVLILFLMKYKSAKNEAEVAIENLSKTEEEYTDYKRKAMEKEQALGRKLQDEINKQKTKKNNN